MKTTSVSRVALIGAGRMGRSMGGYLLGRDWPVVVCDPVEESRAPLVDRGATVADTPAAAASDADLVLVVVVDDDQVRQVLTGPDGVLETARPGTVVAVCASVRPDTCRELADRAAENGVDVLDVAMVGGERGAEAGMMTLYCGGSEDAMARCQPAFAAFAINVCYLGPIGMGQVAKTVNNILLWANIRAGVESLRLAQALGADPGRIRPAVAIGSGGNNVLQQWAQQRLRWPKKDLEVALAMAEEAGVEVPMVAQLADLMAELSVDDLVALR